MRPSARHLVLVALLLLLVFGGALLRFRGHDPAPPPQRVLIAHAPSSTNAGAATAPPAAPHDEPSPRVVSPSENSSADAEQPGALDTASISGIVRDKSGRPVSDATVLAAVKEWTANTPWKESTSAKDGAFTIAGLAAGEYTIRVRPTQSGCATLTEGGQVQLAQGQVLSGIRLVCPFDYSITFSGRVVDSSGNPVADASIDLQMWSADSCATAKSGADGRFAIAGLLAGNYTLNAGCKSYTHYNEPAVDVPNNDVTIVLWKRGSIAGHVLDAGTGSPVKQFQILSYPKMEDNIRIEDIYGAGEKFDTETGEFSIACDEGTRALYVQAKGYSPLLHTLPELQEGRTVSDVVVRMEAGGFVEGLVSDRQGKPVEGADVFVGSVPLPNFSGSPFAWDESPRSGAAKSDAEGLFRVDSLPEGEIRLFVAHRAHPIAEVHATVAFESGSSISVVLDDGGTVTGTVRVGGKPARGYWVSVEAAVPYGARDISAPTGELGEYTLTNLPVGEAKLLIAGGTSNQSRRSRGSVTVVGGEIVMANFDLPAGNAAIEGRVTRNGAPLAMIVIGLQLHRDGGGREDYSTKTDALGFYRFEGMPGGTAALSFGVPVEGQSDSSRHAYPVELSEGETLPFDIALGSGAQVTGNVSGIPSGWDSGVVVIRGAVQAADFTEIETLFETADAATETDVVDSQFHVDGIQEGAYTVIVVAYPPGEGDDEAPRFAVVPVTLERDAAVSLDITVR